MRFRALLAAMLFAASAAHAQKQTVCTITVNSPDEREVFRRHLPADRYDFVELVERGNPDWLGASCRKGVSCDVLLVSGHFAGTEFYSSRHNVDETLPVDVLERAACSGSCPGVFDSLKEVYLFGCDTLNPTPVRTATPEMVRALEREGAAPDEAMRRVAELAQRHGESALDRMRRLFPGVPVIYGFSSKAPYGRYAGPMLDRHFQVAGTTEVGSGAVSERLRKLFAPASMVVSNGLSASEPNADYRAEACRYHDTRLTAAQKLSNIHATLARSMAEARISLDRIERFLGGLPQSDRRRADFMAAQARLVEDRGLRDRFLALARDTADPAVRVRLVTLARDLGWLDRGEERAELMRMVGDLLAARSTDFGEVDLICTLSRDRGLDGGARGLAGVQLVGGAAADAALACLGDGASHGRILDALASRDEREVQIAQAYLRHRPLASGEELRAVALRVAGNPVPAAQARALETLARQGVDDAEVLGRLTSLFAQTRSLEVQRAIAEVFVRAGYRGAGELAPLFRRHRLRSTSGPDIIDTLIARLGLTQ